MTTGPECMRGQIKKPRPQEQAARPAGKSASSAPLILPGALRGVPAEGVDGDSTAAPAQGKAFPKISFAIFMKLILNVFMKPESKQAESEEHLQIQVPSETKYDLGLKALNEREPIRMVVLRALEAYGINVPPDAICDRRKRN